MELWVLLRDDVRALHIVGVDVDVSPGTEDYQAGMLGVVGWVPGSTAWLWSKDRSADAVIADLLDQVDCDLVVFSDSDKELVRREAGAVRRAA